ncbi:MAG: rhodanese-like domain-containing protein [Arsenophonus sp.]
MIDEIIEFINQHSILSITWITLLIYVIVLIFIGLFDKIKNITCNQAIQLINKEEAITIDFRSHSDFCKGHIVNSINLISSEIKDNNIIELEKNKKKPIIVVSVNGIEAYKLAEQLIKCGFERVFILKEGIIGWSKENLPLVRTKK